MRFLCVHFLFFFKWNKISLTPSGGKEIQFNFNSVNYAFRNNYNSLNFINWFSICSYRNLQRSIFCFLLYMVVYFIFITYAVAFYILLTYDKFERASERTTRRYHCLKYMLLSWCSLQKITWEEWNFHKKSKNVFIFENKTKKNEMRKKH